MFAVLSISLFKSITSDSILSSFFNEKEIFANRVGEVYSMFSSSEHLVEQSAQVCDVVLSNFTLTSSFSDAQQLVSSTSISTTSPQQLVDSPTLVSEWLHSQSLKMYACPDEKRRRFIININDTCLRKF